ncbi:MAG: ABC transporter permease [Bacteroidales bacterium]|nr:ABC transporter permease [Bacteroidales bacterium]
MKKISLIIKREYLTRVRKKSFIIMTILGPILMASLMIVPIFIAQMSDETKTIAVVDETGLIYNQLPQTDNLKFEYLITDITTAKKIFLNSNYYALLYVPKSIINNQAAYNRPISPILFSGYQPSLNIKMFIANSIKKEFETARLEASGIDPNVLKSIEMKVDITTTLLKESGKKEESSNSEISTALSIFSGILIYMFIFMFGAQVMRGVIEEKTSRVVEVIISSVKPFQLMMGKIIGIAMVGLTQFCLWIILTLIIITFFKFSFPNIFDLGRMQEIISNPQASQMTMQNIDQIEKTHEVLQGIASINFAVMIISFIFFFLGGYLLYAALFAAIGAAVDSEADTQQFMAPITIPLIFSVIMAQFVINNPNGPVAFWLSMIPLTSPVIMMLRIPFGVSYIQVAASAFLLILGFLFTTWFAAKIYRTGILMYGKKINYKELWKWLTY